MCVSILLLFYTSIVSAFCAKNKRNNFLSSLFCHADEDAADVEKSEKKDSGC